MNLYSRYSDLKQKVGGNREKRSFEFTMGRSVAEANHITEAPKFVRRILSELLFALNLSKRYDGIYDSDADTALCILEDCMQENGVLTRSACDKAEEALLPLQAAAKEYEIIYASHAHIDMNWMWGWQETVAITLSTFRTILNLMDEYPEFTYSQSQASVYKIVEEYAPDMMPEIQKRIFEGRWEVTANAWVETDKNMPDTESLIRHIRITRDYLQNVWGLPKDSVKVDFSPDTFGHSRFVPEINSFGSVPYYYHCRGLQDDLTLYRFLAPSGKEVLMYKEPYWYNSGVNPDNGTGIFELENRCNGLKTGLIVYGVGNHGGGPTRRDIETVLEMKEWPVFPALRFGTLHEFFRKAETVREGLPIIDHELNAIFTGCYTTQSRIKLANRRAEAGLLDSERMTALAHCTLGTPYPHKSYQKAWQNVLFTHFHDILTGSCVQESREYAMGRLAEAIAHAQSEQTAAFAALSRNIDTSMFPGDDDIRTSLSEGAGVGYGIANYAGVPNPERGAGKNRIYTIFNPSAVTRNELVELTVWDYTGDLTHLQVLDSEGMQIDFQLLDEKPVGYWDHQYIRILVKVQTKAFGYTTCMVCEKEVTDYPTHLMQQDREEQPHESIVLENDLLCARFDTGSGMLHSLIYKKTGEELLSAPAGLHLIHTMNGGMTAWRIGRYLQMEPVTDTCSVSFLNGKLRNSVIFEQKVMHSTVSSTISLDEGSDILRYTFKIDWHETGTAQPWIPVLTYRLPLKKASDTILTDVPAGYATRKARQIDVPALTGAAAVCEGVTAALISDCKYGYRLADQVLSVTLINTSIDPDPYPERGIHAIQMFVALTEGNTTSLKQTAETLIRPMTAVPTGCHPGLLPAQASLMSVDAVHSVVSSVQISGDDALTVRLYENGGEAENIAIRAPFVPTKAVLTNLNEDILSELTIEGNLIHFTIGAHEIAQVKIYK